MFEIAPLLEELAGLQERGFRSDTLLRKAVRTLSEADDRFSWVGVYLLNDEGTELWLHNYVGPSTDHVRIPVGAGVCGTAIAERANQNIADVRELENYLSCSPTVRSELVVLIRDTDTLFGQIDIDSEVPNAFTDEDEQNIQQVADQLGVQLAIEKAGG